MGVFKTLLILSLPILFSWLFLVVVDQMEQRDVALGGLESQSTAGGVALMRYLGTFEPAGVRINDTVCSYSWSCGIASPNSVVGLRATHSWCAACAHDSGAYTGVVARTIFIDDYLKTQTQFGYYKQVLIFGGGYDTRALRFQDTWGNTILRGGRSVGLSDAHGIVGVYEIDLPHTQAAKLKILKHAIDTDDLIYRLDRVKYVVGNLNDMEGVLRNLTAAGYNERLPSVVVMEGLLGYLPPVTVNRTFEFFKQHTGPSSMAVFNFGPWVNHTDKTAVDRCYGVREVFREISRKGEPPQSTFPLDKFTQYLQEHGLVLQVHYSSGELEHKCLTKPDKTTLGRVGCWEHMAVVRNADDTPAIRPPANSSPLPTDAPYSVPLDLSFA